MNTLYQVISQKEEGQTGMAAFVDVLDVDDYASLPSLTWIQPLKTSLIPDNIYDTDYVFFGCTNHDTLGRIVLFKGNNLDLSDAVEVGTITSGYQAETNFTRIFTGNPRPVHLYFHTNANDPNNLCGGQETRLMTISGGDLVNGAWTDETTPVACATDQDHTGSLYIHKVGSNLFATCKFAGGVNHNQKLSTTDGLTFTPISNTIDYKAALIDASRSWLMSWGTTFEINGKYYGIYNSVDTANSYPFTGLANAIPHIVEVDANLNIIRMVKTLNDGIEGHRVNVYVEDNVAHFYRETGKAGTTDFNNNIGYTAMDLSFLI